MTRHTPNKTLNIKDLRAWYGDSQALHGASFQVEAGEVVTLLGRNGAGKTTILKSIMGLMSRAAGEIRYGEQPILNRRPDEIAAAGIAICPEERAIFSTLSVSENLLLPPVIAEGGYTVEEIYALFPNLRERADAGGTTLSGGEQQMLAIGRILRTGATLFLLDEPSEGLAPVIVQHIARTIHKMKERGLTVLLVEQNLKFARAVSDRYYVVEQGRIIDACTSAELERDPERIQHHLAI